MRAFAGWRGWVRRWRLQASAPVVFLECVARYRLRLAAVDPIVDGVAVLGEETVDRGAVAIFGGNEECLFEIVEI